MFLNKILILVIFKLEKSIQDHIPSIIKRYLSKVYAKLANLIGSFMKEHSLTKHSDTHIVMKRKLLQVLA